MNTYAQSEYVYPAQLLILGRGVEDANCELPGTAQPEPSMSGGSFESALKVAEYAQEHQVERLVFSGLRSFIMSSYSWPDKSEAYAMCQASVDHGLDLDTVAVVLEEDSQTTYENYLNSLTYFDVTRPIGIVTGSEHMGRALRAGNRVSSRANLVPVYADLRYKEQKIKPSRNDRAAALLFSAAMMGVETDDRTTIRRRNDMVKSSVNGALKTIGSVVQIKEDIAAAVSRRQTA